MITIHIILPAGVNIIDSLLSVLSAIVVALLARFVVGFISG